MTNDNINTTEYQIFIGCKDGYTKNEIVSEEELRNLVSAYFEKKCVDFSLIPLTGVFLYDNGDYVIEDTLCINIISDNEDEIKTLAKDLSMFMNQNCTLIVKNEVSAEYR